MAKSNGKSEAETAGLDLEHELPSGDGDERSGEASSGTVTSPGEVAGPEADLQKLKAERDSLLDRLARAQAEFENARRRASKEQQDFRDYAAADAIKPLLPVMDSFERALQAKSESGDFRSGVELIYKQLQDALAKLGVRAIPAKGEPFDPHVHEAIEMVETSDVPDHEVLEELQRGYKLKDRLLRPAMVKVAKNS
ncbi:MAG TPA: nucleotide exchange factor GrpE [Candidatus Sulfotelmatobacter sp.]|jgi:molecular chaperone GrpE|nr:nucleotide exchange factor GrpE [Candidatus Sulfotelmatobacter sp.]